MFRTFIKIIFTAPVWIKRVYVGKPTNFTGVFRGDLWAGINITINNFWCNLTFLKTVLESWKPVHHGHSVKMWRKKMFWWLSGQAKRILTSDFWLWMTIKAEIFYQPQYFIKIPTNPGFHDFKPVFGFKIPSGRSGADTELTLGGADFLKIFRTPCSGC